MAVTLYGVAAVSFMMVMYALEHRHRRFIAGFALGCVSTFYGFLSGAWPFGIIELIWAATASRRYLATSPATLRIGDTGDSRSPPSELAPLAGVQTGRSRA